MAGGAVTGLAADIATGGLTLGAGTIGGAIAGALGGVGAATAYNVKKGTKENLISWSPSAMEGFVVETVLLYLAVALLRPRPRQMGTKRISCLWKSLVEKIVKEENFDFKDFRNQKIDADQRKAEFVKLLDSVTRKVFKRTLRRNDLALSQKQQRGCCKIPSS